MTLRANDPTIYPGLLPTARPEAPRRALGTLPSSAITLLADRAEAGIQRNLRAAFAQLMEGGINPLSGQVLNDDGIADRSSAQIALSYVEMNEGVDDAARSRSLLLVTKDGRVPTDRQAEYKQALTDRLRADGFDVIGWFVLGEDIHPLVTSEILSSALRTAGLLDNSDRALPPASSTTNIDSMSSEDSKTIRRAVTHALEDVRRGLENGNVELGLASVDQARNPLVEWRAAPDQPDTMGWLVRVPSIASGRLQTQYERALETAFAAEGLTLLAWHRPLAGGLYATLQCPELQADPSSEQRA